MKKVVWGVISTAKIGRERVLPGMQKSELLEIRAIASRDEGTARRAADALGIPQRLRLVRGAARRSRDRGGLQPAAQPPARAADARRRRRRASTCCARSRSRSRPARRRRSATRREAGADRGGVHGALPPAVAARARAGARGPHRRAARRAGVLRLQQPRSRQHPQPGRHRRRRPLRHRLLRDRRRAATSSTAEPARGDRAGRPRSGVSAPTA